MKKSTRMQVNQPEPNLGQRLRETHEGVRRLTETLEFVAASQRDIIAALARLRHPENVPKRDGLRDVTMSGTTRGVTRRRRRVTKGAR